MITKRVTTSCLVDSCTTDMGGLKNANLKTSGILQGRRDGFLQRMCHQLTCSTVQCQESNTGNASGDMSIQEKHV